MSKLLVSSLALLVFVSAFSAEARTHHRTSTDLDLEEADDSAAIAQTKVPEDFEVCFSPEEHCDRKIVKFIETAQRSLDIAIFDVNLNSLVKRIIERSKKIRIRMVVDRIQAKGRYSAVPKLLAAGIDIRYGHQHGSGIMHNKFIIVDGKMLETGSFNETHHASFFNAENQIYLANPKVVERYKDRFETLWKDGRPAK
jgi:phosphatidylserine/phosphatidylglycerophosphate/cardiolipin synthase-like enzyme